MGSDQWRNVAEIVDQQSAIRQWLDSAYTWLVKMPWSTDDCGHLAKSGEVRRAWQADTTTWFLVTLRVLLVCVSWTTIGQPRKRLHLQSAAVISRHSALSEDRIRQCATSSEDRVSPQGHRSVSVSRYFLLQAPQCSCSVRKRFNGSKRSVETTVAEGGQNPVTLRYVLISDNVVLRASLWRVVCVWLCAGEMIDSWDEQVR